MADSRGEETERGEADSVTRREIAERYVKKQLATMDGSFEAALARIGMERYEKLVADIMKALPGAGPGKTRE